MYSFDEIERTIRSMDTQQLIDRWERGQFSEDFIPVAAAELQRREIDPDGPMPAPEPLPSEPVSDFSLDDLPFWKRLFTFKGRASRLKFWAIIPAAWISFMYLGWRLEFMFSRDSDPLWPISVFGPLLLIAWIHWATITQRLHDRNKSGKRAWILFMPLIGPIWALIELGCLPGTPGPNRYGRN